VITLYSTTDLIVSSTSNGGRFLQVALFTNVKANKSEDICIIGKELSYKHKESEAVPVLN
jgi:hypothetical protein